MIGLLDDWIVGFLHYGIHEATQFEPGLHDVGRVAAGDGLV
jgi:hypothetical protein